MAAHVNLHQVHVYTEWLSAVQVQASLSALQSQKAVTA